MLNDDTTTPLPTSSAHEPSQRRGVSRRRSAARLAAPVLALVALLGVAACSGAGSPAAPSAAAAVNGQSSPFANVGAVPATVDGTAFDAASLTGKPAVLWFWAPWCTVCRQEAPTVTKVASEFAGEVQFVGVAGRASTADMADFVEQTGTGDLVHLADTSGAVWREYGVAVQPAYAFIDSDGRVDVRVGSLDEDALRARVAEVAAGTPPSTLGATPTTAP